MLYWGSGKEECHQGAVRLWLVPPRQVRCKSRATGEAHQEGALDGATGAPSPPFILTFSHLPVLSTFPPLPFQLSQINVSLLLFIYMNIYINKYHTFRLFSLSGDCYHCFFFRIFFFLPPLLLSLILKIS